MSKRNVVGLSDFLKWIHFLIFNLSQRFIILMGQGPIWLCIHIIYYKKKRKKSIFFCILPTFSYLCMQKFKEHCLHMKKFFIFLLVAVGVVIGMLMCKGTVVQESGDRSQVAGDYRSVDSLPMIITQIRKCSKLYTAEYRVHKIVTHDDVLRLKGSVLQREFNIKLPLGDRKIAIPIDAKLKAWIDFSQISERNIERRGDHITIILPDPQVTMTSSKIDQQHVKQYVALARANFSDAEMSAYEQQGRAAIINDIPNLGILETAQANAAKVLVPMLTEMGYEEHQVTVAFRKHYDATDIPHLIRSEE